MFRSAITFFVILLATTSTQAGFVFLKNGYILQGEIKERTSEKVVLEYQNGEVTLESRYIRHVVLDPSEEALLEKRRAAKLRAKDQNPRDLLVQRNIRLPKLEQIIDLNPRSRDLIDTEASSGSNPSLSPESTASVTNSPAGDSGTTVEEHSASGIVTPVAMEFAEMRFSLRVPPGWKPQVLSGLVVLAPESLAKEGQEPLPNLKIQRLDKTDLGLETVSELMSTVLGARHPELQLAPVEDLMLGTVSAKLFTGSYSEKQMDVMHILVKHGNSLYHITAQWSLPLDAEQHSAVEDCISSLYFYE